VELLVRILAEGDAVPESHRRILLPCPILDGETLAAPAVGR
jgi:hypothetical protein